MGDWSLNDLTIGQRNVAEALGENYPMVRIEPLAPRGAGMVKMTPAEPCDECGGDGFRVGSGPRYAFGNGHFPACRKCGAEGNVPCADPVRVLPDGTRASAEGY